MTQKNTQGRRWNGTEDDPAIARVVVENKSAQQTETGNKTGDNGTMVRTLNMQQQEGG